MTESRFTQSQHFIHFNQNHWPGAFFILNSKEGLLKGKQMAWWVPSVAKKRKTLDFSMQWFCPEVL